MVIVVDYRDYAKASMLKISVGAAVNGMHRILFQIASLQADLMSAERKHREKVEQLLKDKDEAIQMVIERHRQANKQVSL